MTLSFWQRAGRAPAMPCDVAVVGGGVLGCAAAYWLRRRRPALRVLIVEAQALGSGASGRSAGFLLQGAASADYLADREAHGADRVRRLWHFTRENRDLVFSELDGAAFGLEASGSLVVAGSPVQDERLQAAVPVMRGDGAPVAYLPPRETNRRLRSQGFQGALYVPSGAMLNPLALVRRIAAAAEADVLEHHPVAEVRSEAEHVVLETPMRRVEAGQVVLATGAHLPRLVPTAEAYARPVRAQMLATEPAPRRWLRVPAYTHDGFFYVRQDPAGRVLLGGARHLHERNEVGYEDATTPALQADLERYLHRHFPQTEDLPVACRWSGTMSFSPDRVPVVGAVPELPGSFWAAGCSGHGLAYGFRLGRLLAELVLGGGRPEGYDLFTAERFSTR